MVVDPKSHSSRHSQCFPQGHPRGPEAEFSIGQTILQLAAVTPKLWRDLEDKQTFLSFRGDQFP